MKQRVLLIGVDSADAELVECLADAGHLPTFAALRRDGLWSRLRTTAEIMHVSAWPTIYTGVTPGHHGLYHAYQVRAGDQRIQRTEPSWAARPPFWKHLDAAGRRCVILDAFMDYPLDGFRGIQILEYGTWTWFGRPGSTPSGLLQQILSRFGPYPGPEHMEVTSVPADLVRLRDRLVGGATRKAEVTRWLMCEHPWDFLFVTFGEPHGAGHYLWHAHDHEHPSHPPGGVRGMPTPLRDVYMAVDQAIASVLAAADDNTTVIVVSGDGMGPNYSGCNHMLPLLSRMGLLRSVDAGSHKGGWVKRLRGMVPLPVRRAVTRCLPKHYQHGLNTGWMNQGTDWAHTQAFLIPNSNEAYLRLNQAGREPEGIVPAAEADALLRHLQGELGQLTNPDNGVVAAKRATVVDDVFPGSERVHLPDLVVSWDARARIAHRIATPSHGTVEARPAHETAPFYTGNHRGVAFVGARGPNVRQGSLPERSHIVDLPATVMELLGVDPPEWLEGQTWDEVIPGVDRHGTGKPLAG